MVLSLVMTQYDPLGLVSPLLVHAKILLRRLYGQAELDWDDPLQWLNRQLGQTSLDKQLI